MATAIIIIFVLGYLGIAFEHNLQINKSATALVTGVLCWTVYIFFSDSEIVNEELAHHLGDISQILFFLMGAMTIVELIDAHDGFETITRRIKTTNKTKILWIISFLTFFLSALLDNLTTTIVMISLIRKLIDEEKDRWVVAGLIVIAANAGGAWSPIGDVTTTMLWIGNQITALNIIVKLILPSLFCLLIPLFIMQVTFKGKFKHTSKKFGYGGATKSTARERIIVLFTGLGFLLFVPVFKSVTHLPPFMGMMLGLGLMWMITETIHSGKDEENRKPFTVAHALRKIDSSSVLFFLGILLAVSSLAATGQLRLLAGWMDDHMRDRNLIVTSIGVLSSVVDNVPLVAAAQGMYSLQTFPTDHYFWEFLAYCTGTGGSILIIGSAAGVAAMGLEKINFIWYLKKVAWLAFIGYLSGAFIYILQDKIVPGW
ncbi:MAG TPA: sodium:proton antiporter NhaD [Chitinophagaceae bacterium]|nr:sodium:proton antiporter NhaD [Chitinophagaceae bacterium]